MLSPDRKQKFELELNEPTISKTSMDHNLNYPQTSKASYGGYNNPLSGKRQSQGIAGPNA